MVVTSCVSSVLPSGSADCLTTDGRVVTIRPAEPADAAALVALHERSSDRTRYFRYFSVQRQLDEADARRFVTVDHRGREAFVVLERGTVVGIGGYDSLADPSIAELSFLVDDAHQRRGIGSLLLEHLSERARARGFHYLEASVLAINHLMLGVFTLAGFQQRHQLEDGVVELLLDLDDPSVARPSIEAREHVADIASMRRILQPGGIVFVTGAPEQDAIGRALATRGSDLAGPTFAVNPAGVTIGGASGHRSLSDIPEDLDLAVITVGPEALASTLERCGDRHVSAALVTTPVSHPAAALELRTVARGAGMRLVGPGSGGIEQRHHGLHALIDPAAGPAGPVGVACQSSSIAGAVTRGLDRCGVGVASVVTLGAKADVSGNDLLQAWSDDPTVRVAVLQLESLGNPFRFARIARTVGRDLPVVLLRTAGLHESLAADDAALLRQLGIIDVPSIDEAVDVAALLATEPPPAGRRVGVVSRGRGPGLVARDQLQDLGLHVTHVRAVPTGRALVEDVRAMRDTPGIDALCLVPGEGDEVPRSAGPAGLPVVVVRRPVARSDRPGAGPIHAARRMGSAGRSARRAPAAAGPPGGPHDHLGEPVPGERRVDRPRLGHGRPARLRHRRRPDPTSCAGSKTPAKRHRRSATPSSSTTPSATAPSPSARSRRLRPWSRNGNGSCGATARRPSPSP